MGLLGFKKCFGWIHSAFTYNFALLFRFGEMSNLQDLQSS